MIFQESMPTFHLRGQKWDTESEALQGASPSYAQWTGSIETVDGHNYFRNALNSHYSDASHRQLAGIYYGSPNWIAMFCLIGFIIAYLTRTVFWPYFKKCWHWTTKRRVDTTLTGLEMLEELENMEYRVDPETGAVVRFEIAKEEPELERMKRMLTAIAKVDAEEERVRRLENEDKPVYGPDGKLLLPDIVIDDFGNIIDPDGNIEEGKEDEESKEEDSNGLIQWEERKSQIASNASSKAERSVAIESNLKASKRDKRGKSKVKKKMTPKQLAALERKNAENRAFREAYRKSTYIPKLEERLTVVKEEFEKRMLHGEEPLGFQLTLETRKYMEENSDTTQYIFQNHGNFFHKLVKEETIRITREKYSDVIPEISPRVSEIMNPKFQHNGGRAVPVQGRMVTNQSRGRSKSARSRKRDKPLRSEGRNLEDADARDRSVITRGQGMLPTRSPSPSPERNDDLNAKEDVEASGLKEKIQYFKKDGSGQMASAQEVVQIEREKARLARMQKKAGAHSPDGSRSPSPHAHAPGEEEIGARRPRTAAQFRKSYY